MEKIVTAVLLFALVLFSGCLVAQTRAIPASERPCTTDAGRKMTLGEAIQVARASECMEQGTLRENYSWDENAYCGSETGTWWLIMDTDEDKNGCEPVCIIDIKTKAVLVEQLCPEAET